MGKRRKNPFRPGWGIEPPHRAGHKDAERQLDMMLERICDREPGGGVVLYGPRGTGKTVLLGELREKAKKQKVRVINLAADQMTGGAKKLGRMLTPWRWFHLLAIRRLAAMFPWGGGAEVEFGDPAASTADRALRLLLKDPVLLLVDEAHEMPPGFAKVLLSVAQRCINERFPLLVVLAGTPGLRANLRRARVSFWERSTRLRMGRLESKDATRGALSLPAEESGLPFSPDALELLVVESQNYPFFIQLLGEQSWMATIARDPNADRIGLEDAQAGVRKANTTRDELYEDRLGEIRARKVKSEALAVSKAFFELGGDGVLPTARLEAVLKPALTRGRTAEDAADELFAVGLIWRTEDDHSLWEPGIPSLCTYMANNTMGG